jgi:hypothetical protein
MRIVKILSSLLLAAVIGTFGTVVSFAAPETSQISAASDVSTVPVPTSAPQEESSEESRESSSENSESFVISDIPVKPNYSFSDNTKGNADLTAIEEVLTDTGFYQFIATTTRDGNVFYIIIDKSKDSDNVYFLNEVDTYDLKALLNTKSGDTVKVGENDNTLNEEETSTDEKEQSQSSDSGNMNTYLIILIGAAVLGVIGFVAFKIKKGGLGKKQKADIPMIDDDFEDDEEINEDKELKR